jgi:hypothetical protein
MVSIFRHHDYTTVGWLHSILEAEGIPSHVKNYAASMGITEIPIPEFYPDLCVLNEEDVERAIEILRSYLTQQADPPADWTCPACHEAVPGTMATCWNCNTAAPLPVCSADS